MQQYVFFDCRWKVTCFVLHVVIFRVFGVKVASQIIKEITSMWRLIHVLVATMPSPIASRLVWDTRHSDPPMDHINIISFYQIKLVHSLLSLSPPPPSSTNQSCIFRTPHSPLCLPLPTCIQQCLILKLPASSPQARCVKIGRVWWKYKNNPN